MIAPQVWEIGGAPFQVLGFDVLLQNKGPPLLLEVESRVSVHPILFNCPVDKCPTKSLPRDGCRCRLFRPSVTGVQGLGKRTSNFIIVLTFGSVP